MPTKKNKKNKKSAKSKAARRPSARKAATKPASRKAPDRRSRAPESLRLRAASPGFTVDNLEKSLAFYRDVMGFYVKDRWLEDGKLSGVELVAGSVTFYIGQDDWKKGRDRAKGEGFRVYCTTVQDVDALAARIRARGGTLLEEPKTQSWGSRDFAVADPDGFKITISNNVTK